MKVFVNIMAALQKNQILLQEHAHHHYGQECSGQRCDLDLFLSLDIHLNTYSLRTNLFLICSYFGNFTTYLILSQIIIPVLFLHDFYQSFSVPAWNK